MEALPSVTLCAMGDLSTRQGKQVGPGETPASRSVQAGFTEGVLADLACSAWDFCCWEGWLAVLGRLPRRRMRDGSDLDLWAACLGRLTVR